MLKHSVQYSQTQKYHNLDALLVCGDMTNRGVEEELVPFCDAMNTYLPSETKRVLCMGSHEYMGGDRPLWEQLCKTPASSHQVINGYHFIALSPDDTNESDGVFANKIDWVRGELDKAAQDDPNRPIFFIQHYHVSRPAAPELESGQSWWLRGRSTIRSDRTNWGASDLFELFEQYPQIVDFSGHSHYPISDPGVAWQGNFSAFGTGTLCYAKMIGEPYNVTPPGRFSYAQFFIVEVSRSHSVRLRVFDLPSESFTSREYFIERPGERSTYQYTDERIEQPLPPVWNEKSAIQVEDRLPDGVCFHFPQAKNGEEVQSYRIIIRPTKKSDDSSPTNAASEPPVVDRLVWSEFYFHPMPKELAVFETSLKTATDYRVEIFALNFFGKESATSLTAEFTTPAFLPWNC